MIVRTLDDLLVYQKAQDACGAISAVLERPKVRADWDLRVQLASASAAVAANIAEGFGQQSDRQFARYLYISRGSSHEVRAHLDRFPQRCRTSRCEKRSPVPRGFHVPIPRSRWRRDREARLLLRNKWRTEFAAHLERGTGTRNQLLTRF